MKGVHGVNAPGKRLAGIEPAEEKSRDITPLSKDISNLTHQQPHVPAQADKEDKSLPRRGRG